LTCTSYGHVEVNKQLSYRRETALQGGLVIAKSGRLELEDNIYGHTGLYSATVTYLASKEIEISEKTQNKGYYAVQGHPRSSRSAPIESPYATSY